ncbi:CAP domain-containing protein [Paracoccus aurantiacus]|uniref:CAP domain-containing protein n=1 Tax=Paracoccus aurantiacus TaxID=2599412 RepID=A0A5C6S4G9_9RHOB|nr:CAP domain-containing protein [Paracoccus aurantiacus]TXB68473.1 CAP domain-containing protein [Paracoccus aurantiacus]
MNILRAAGLIFTASLGLTACGPQTPAEPELTARTSTLSPRLPKGIVRTDGHEDIYVASAGRAQCLQTAAADAATALASTNASRAQHGLAPLRTDPRLQRSAESHACDMAQRGTLTHAGGKSKGPMGRVKQRGYKPRLAAENIAGGRFDLGRVMSEWSSSPGHRSNMMIAGLRDFGIGKAVAADGKIVFWAAVYAQPAR